MKILGICILIMIPLIAFSLTIDILQGFDLATSIRNALSPFNVMEAPEQAVLFFFLFLLAIQFIQSFIKKRKRGDGSLDSSTEEQEDGSPASEGQ
ncbi:hypothetical protein R4Z09_26880 [Niallia oryzisoli]|uniref:Uncharacterized protein n=1 Tax=Niallia oryzisoli TaxID=1737571 RepID=A0ABZ2CAP0_9BACI